MLKKLTNKKGQGLVEVMIILAISVVIGGVLLALLNKFIPDFWNALSAKILDLIGL